MTGYLIAGVALYGLMLGGLYFGQRALMYHPDPTVPFPHRHDVPEMEAVRVPVSGGVEVLCWWHPPETGNHPVVVYFHGNAGHIGERGYKVRHMIDAGYGVLLTGYRYNAQSGGKPSEELLLADGRALVEHVESQGVAPERLVLYGESLGSGIAVALASERNVGALVLETPYSTMAEVAQSHYWYAPAKWLVRDSYDSMARIGRVRAPILLFHGDADTTIPVRFAKRLFEAAPEPKEARYFPGGAHTDLYEHGAGHLVVDFIGRAVAANEAGETAGAGSA